ncbi:MAG: hypothetical protein Q9163_001618 [Psora crenata]
MHFHLFAGIALTLGSCTAVPFQKRVPSPEVDDGIILNYFLTVVYLQRALYREGLQIFRQKDFTETGFEDSFYTNIQQIYQDEEHHITFLIQALQAAGIPQTEELTYSFPYSDAASWTALAGIIEGISTSAFLGAAASIADKDYLTASNSILTVEACHTSYIRAALAESPYPNPFGTPLPFNEVHTLASLFITENPDPVHLPFQAFPDLSLQCSPYYYE